MQFITESDISIVSWEKTEKSLLYLTTFRGKMFHGSFLTFNEGYSKYSTKMTLNLTF